MLLLVGFQVLLEVPQEAEVTVLLPSRPFQGAAGWLYFLLAVLVGTSISVPLKLHLHLLLHLPSG